MDQLKEAIEIEKRISLGGSEREQALAAFHSQIEAWDVALPKVEPLVWDFGLKDYGKVGLIEYWVANEIKAGYCAKYLFVADGQACPLHRHKTKSETFFIVKGKVRMECDGSVREMVPGEAHFVEAQTLHTFSGIGPALLLEVSMTCMVDDNFFDDERIPIGGNYNGGEK